MNTISDEMTALSDQEQARVDALLKSARTFHYWCFVLAGLSLAISSLDRFESIQLPLGGLVLPSVQAAIAIYIVALVFGVLSERLFYMAYPWLRLDKRRPPFPWIAIGSTSGYSKVTYWILMPILLCGIFTSFVVLGDYVGMGLVYGGLGVVILPRTISSYRELITKRADHRGGKSTLSVFLLYWYRIFRQSLLTCACMVAVLAAVPKWRTGLLQLLSIMLAVFGVMYLVRMIAAIGPIYRWIDRRGKHWEFPVQSEHYH